MKRDEEKGGQVVQLTPTGALKELLDSNEALRLRNKELAKAVKLKNDEIKGLASLKDFNVLAALVKEFEELRAYNVNIPAPWGVIHIFIAGEGKQLCIDAGWPSDKMCPRLEATLFFDGTIGWNCKRSESIAASKALEASEWYRQFGESVSVGLERLSKIKELRERLRPFRNMAASLSQMAQEEGDSK